VKIIRVRQLRSNCHLRELSKQGNRNVGQFLTRDLRYWFFSNWPSCKKMGSIKIRLIQHQPPILVAIYTIISHGIQGKQDRRYELETFSTHWPAAGSKELTLEEN